MIMFTNKQLVSILIGISIMALALSDCASGAQAVQPVATPSPGDDLSVTPEAVSHGDEIGGFVELVDALRAAGAEVEPVEPIEQPFFDASGQIIKVNGADVQVFEFVDEDARMAASDQISPDGSSTGTTMITWVDQPNFWAKGRIIVLYVGKDAPTIDFLSGVMGKPITTHP
jgi:hypothetical protein